MRRKFTNKYKDILNANGPMAVLKAMHNEEISYKNIRVFGWENKGASSYDHDLYTSVNLYLFEDLNIEEAIIPEGLGNRPKTIKESTKYITVHDTAGAREGAGAVAHKVYVCNGGNQTSWHYSLGNDGIFHHLPNDEVGWHAGDGSLVYKLDNSNVKATNSNPTVDISKDGYYVLNDIKSTILAPTKEGEILTKDYLNDLSIEVQIGEDGNYYLGQTWYSKGYNKIGNGGGNRNSIGIESCIDKGSDMYLTWQMLAKLVAYLLVEQNLNLDAVVQHHFFSGKDCPMTMRRAGMWNHFLDLVEAEHFIMTEMKDYNISLQSHSNNVAKNGRIINQDNIESELKYTITIKDSVGKEFTETFISKK